MADTASLVTGILGVWMFLFLGIFAVYFGMVFFLGLMFYYFTGTKEKGESLINTLMRVLARMYNEIWMITSVFVGWYGVSLLLKAFMGLFAGFTYSEKLGSGSYNPQQTDLQLGVILTMFAVVVFAIHWGFNYLVQTTAEKKGTLMTKIFVGSGLTISGFALFGTVLTFCLQLVSYAQQGGSAFGVKPGATLAVLLASIPVWGYYVARAMMMVRREA